MPSELIAIQQKRGSSPGAAIIIIAVKAQPRARREGIVGTWNGSLKVAVREPAEGGKANVAILTVLARELGLRKQSLQIVSGLASSKKQISISEISESDLLRRIHNILSPMTKTDSSQ
ncbi:MAG: DUF167 domain-containing protein [Planctomycetota bacterium]